jgi:hypothetical protein
MAKLQIEDWETAENVKEFLEDIGAEDDPSHWGHLVWIKLDAVMETYVGKHISEGKFPIVIDITDDEAEMMDVVVASLISDEEGGNISGGSAVHIRRRS